MSWNYRVVRRRHEYGGKDVYTFGIHEVYYNDEGKPRNLTVDPVTLCGQSREDVREDLELMLGAFSSPVLDYDEINEVVER